MQKIVAAQEARDSVREDARPTVKQEAAAHHAKGVASSGFFSESPRAVAQRRQFASHQDSPRMQAQRSQMSALGLPGGLRQAIETETGMDMSDVRVHRNSHRPARVNAHAYTQGNDIHIESGGERHLPHEAWHVVQQRRGLVAPTRVAHGVAINDNAALEGEADAMGAKLASASKQAIAKSPAASAPHAQVAVQRAASRVLQRDGDYDEEAKKAWDDRIEEIVRLAFQRPGIELTAQDIEESAVACFKAWGLLPPSKASIDELEDYQEFCRELESVSVDEVLGHAEALKRYTEWKNYESDDESSGDENDDARYYSSEDDETPDDREHFDEIVAVIRSLNALLNEYLGDLPANQHYEAEAQRVIESITEYKTSKKAGPPPKKKTKRASPGEKGAGQAKTEARKIAKVKVSSVSDWLSFGHEFNEAKRGATQKPTVYDIQYDVWEGAQASEIQFRGRQLKDAEGGPGRSWPQIAQALHELAMELGTALLQASRAASQQRTGTRLLAAAMLAVLNGRGKEVRGELSERGVSEEALGRFEKLVLEFFSLALGIETIRLPFAAIDTVLHLNAIASGTTIGDDSKDHPYDFRNVYSSVRGVKGAPRHAYTRGKYHWHRRRNEDDYAALDELEIFEQTHESKENVEKEKELTHYRGHRLAAPEDALNRPKERGEIKSAKSVGKSVYSHSAGHGKTTGLLERSSVEVEKLWSQVRPIDDSERREVHSARLQSIGPIRAYNLIAGIVRRHEQELGDSTPDQIARQLFELYVNFVEGVSPSSSNPFRHEIQLLSGGDFSHSVEHILLGHSGHKVDRGVRKILLEVLASEKRPDELDDIEPQALMIAMVDLVKRESFLEISLLHAAVATGSVTLVQLALRAGAELDKENKAGETPLEQAKGNEGIAEVLSAAHDKQKKRPAKLPSGWQGHKRENRRGEWLEDADVQQGIDGQGLQNTHVVPPVDIVRQLDTLSDIVRDDYLHQYQQQDGVQAYTVVPLNLNGAHWVTLIIEQNALRRSQPVVYLFDSMGADQESVELVRLMLRSTGIYTNADTITDLSESLQNDGYTCGTWAIQSAATIVNALQEGKGINEIKELLRGLEDVIQALHEENVLNRVPAAISGEEKRTPTKKRKREGDADEKDMDESY